MLPNERSTQIPDLEISRRNHARIVNSIHASSLPKMFGLFSNSGRCIAPALMQLHRTAVRYTSMQQGAVARGNRGHVRVLVKTVGIG